MLPTIDLKSLRFDQPLQLWLLVIPAALLVVWMWRLNRHWRDLRRYRAQRMVPMRERLPLFGELLFWLCLIFASVATIVGTARPVAATSSIRTGGVDLIILQDGSASMWTPDVAGNRWQRSIKFLRVLGESLRWKNDRIAMALFAHIATPQVRLTSDPNTYFFFLDHLDRQSPFRLEDDTTWDTNTELGITWGLRLVDKDEELRGGPSANAKMFLLLSDGQSWTGQVQKAIRQSQTKGVPIFVVGVGTASGGMIPEPPPRPVYPGQTPPEPQPPVHSQLDRASLMQIADAGGGQYLELDRDSDREIANRIVDAARRRAPSKGAEGIQELYWQCLLVAAVFLGLGIIALRDRGELWLQTAGAASALALVWILSR